MGSKDPNSEPHACVASAVLSELSPQPRISSLKRCLQTKETCLEKQRVVCRLGPWAAPDPVGAHGGRCVRHTGMVLLHDHCLPTLKIFVAIILTKFLQAWGSGSWWLSAPTTDGLP